MPLISVWPVSLSAFTLNVGSSQLQHFEGRRPSLSLSADDLRLDRLADDRLGERDRFQQDRVLRVAERVAGDRSFRPMTPTMSPAGPLSTSSRPRAGSAWMW